MTASIFAATSNGRDKYREHAFYPTPPLATEAILPIIRHFPGPVWECACGDGAMATILQREHRVISTDLVDRGFGVSGRDFLTDAPAVAKSIVTNPPFNKAQEFIERAHELGFVHVAMLLKADFWNAKIREKLWAINPPSKILGLTWRLDFTGAGRPHRNCIWCIWDPAETGTSYALLGKPEA